MPRLALKSPSTTSLAFLIVEDLPISLKVDSILKPKTYSWDSPICFNNPIHKYNGIE